MIRNCKTCGGRIRYDIKSEGLVCDSCSSFYNIGDFGNDTNEDMDCDIYACSSCGAELIINNTESSTFCPFCGNATVVMNRVAKVKKPEVILPFEVSAQEAVKNIKLMFNRGFFIPDVVHPEVEDMRGIYIPYHVTNVEFDGSKVYIARGGKYNNTSYMASGYCSAKWVTTDASKKFNDTFSQRMEPFYFDKFREFNEDYLLGFYSDIADELESEAIAKARVRVMDMANDVFDSALFPPEQYDARRFFLDTRFTTEVYDKPVTAMLPAWFYTYNYNGKPYTIAVNGQTGQVSGSVPWSQKKFVLLTTLLSVLFTAVLFVPFLFMPTELLTILFISSFPVLSIITLLLNIVIAKLGGYKNLRESINLTNIAATNSLTGFVNNRQEGQ